MKKTKRDSSIQIGTDWEEFENGWLNTGENLFLNPAYLRGLNSVCPEGCQLIFAQLKTNESVQIQAVFQTMVLEGRRDFKPNQHLNASRGRSFVQNAFNGLVQFIIRPIKVNFIIIGNMMNVGLNFIHFDEELDHQERIVGLDQLIKATQFFIREKTGKRYNSILIKELDSDNDRDTKKLEELGYFPFHVEPNMLLNIEWENMEAYLSRMSSKYRVRYKRARKKLGDLTSVQLGLEELSQYQSEMFQLYKLIADKAQFNMVKLKENYHVELKRQLKQDYQVYAYFKEDQLIGFYTLHISGSIIDAGYLGVANEANKEHQLYLNMLYDMIEKATDQKAKQLVLARTALEIKSSVGAVPEEKILFLKNSNSIIHGLAKIIVGNLNKPTEWVQRSPFKN